MWISEIVEVSGSSCGCGATRARSSTWISLFALRNLLQSILPDADDAEIDDLGRRSYTNKESGNKSDMLFRSVDLDDSAIVVEAYRSSIAHLTAIDRLMELALRRDKIFRQIEDR
jgi:hypothetical protein